MKTDLIDVAEAVIEGRLDKMDIEWKEKAAVCVVLASGGYPDSYKKGYVIEGLDEAEKMDDIILFHAATTTAGCDIVTSGGRVLGVVGLGNSIKEAIDHAYSAVSLIKFKDMHYRKDIGKRALK
jgi:phosphoribosylamine--glycine ligase